MVFDLLTKALDLLMGSQLVKDKLQRNEHVIRLLKQLGLSPDQPPADFDGVYTYALVEYGVGKPKPCLEIFRQSEIRKIFKTAFGDNNAQHWLTSGEQFLDQSPIGQDVRSIGLDPKRELAAFAACFITVTKQTRNPSEVMLSHQVTSVQQTLQQLIERLDRLPSLEGIRTELANLAGAQPALLSGAAAPNPAQSCRAFALGQQVRGWFETLGYRFESYEVWDANYFEWIINIPVRRGRYDRILVRGVDGEVGVRDVRSLAEVAAQQKTDEGWLVTARRISQAARNALEQPDYHSLAAFTLDELLDQDADFTGYLDWLAAEIAQRGIEARYVPLACTKEEVDPITHQRLGISRYGAEDGWTEGYLDRWLDDPAKEHLSILGEFGTGKTWLTLHYAAQVLRQYREAQAKGMARPRLPIVVPLRDYAKAVSVESLFSEFFFRKHEIPIPGYSAFEQLNRMGKLLLIFDGFDEMAARVDKQQMINNFWELAKVVVPGSKVILTCRTEHFPEAREGRALLNAELQASTRDLTGETPQFEVLELEKFDDGQIRQVLQLQAAAATVDQVMGNPQLLDLARRPVMTELILEALPDIEAGKPVDMSRVYLYAVRRKMERDIKAERTFTSMADKLYFLCELSWEMLSTDRMSLNYREFPDRIRKLFGSAVQEEKDLDHWHYDMMGQTMLIRNADGDYTPAHRSLLEFFVAFKFAAELGALAPDFLELAQMRGDIDWALEPREYTWSEYFETRDQVAPLASFKTESLEKLRSGFGELPLPKAVVELLKPFIQGTQRLLFLLKTYRSIQDKQIKYLTGNLINICLNIDNQSLATENLSQTYIRAANFQNAKLKWSDFSNCIFQNCQFTQLIGKISTLAFSPDGELLATGDSNNIIRLWNVKLESEVGYLFGHASWVYTVAFSHDGKKLASGSYDGTVRIWSIPSGECIQVLYGHTDWVRSVSFSPDGKFIASASAEIIIWDESSGKPVRKLEGHQSWIYSVDFHPEKNYLVSGSYDKTIRVWNILTGSCLMVLHGHQTSIQSVSFSPSGKFLASAGDLLNVWDAITGEIVASFNGHHQAIWSAKFSPDEQVIATSSADQTIKLWSLESKACLRTMKGHTDRVYSLAFHSSGEFLASAGHDASIRFWNIFTGEVTKIIEGYSNGIICLQFSPNGGYLAVSKSNKIVEIFGIISDETIPLDLISLVEFSEYGSWVQCVNFSPLNNRLVDAGININVWDDNALEHSQVLSDSHDLTLWLDFDSTGKLMASSGDDSQVKLWNMETHQCIQVFYGHSNRVWQVVFSYDDKFLISCSSDETLKIWAVDSGQCIDTKSGHKKRIYTLDSHPLHHLFASGGDDRIVRIWNLESQKCVLELLGHEGEILSLKFSIQGEFIATGSADCTIRIWDTYTGQCLKILTGHTASVNSLTFHPNSVWLASGGADGSIKIWDLYTGECLLSDQNFPYEGMNITGVKGLTPATIASLKALGAVEDEE
ncbi:MAG: hypothetical protein B0A82_05510 [Alkalinema sp. CACIAM 70d]|nr:MAG: hypothetical protein B0A82_05510 [Alkalinema sp. CACIAM 70d]